MNSSQLKPIRSLVFATLSLLGLCTTGAVANPAPTDPLEPAATPAPNAIGGNSLLAAVATPPGSQTDRDRAPAFLARGDIKGIDISPPVDDWDAPAYGMTPVRLVNLAAAGFNTHRVWINLPEFLDPPVSLEHTVSKWIAYIDRSVQAGFRAQVGMGASWDQATAIVNDRATRERFHRAIGALCRAMGSYFSETQVALEMLNEPPGKDRIPTYYSSAAPSWFRTCRAAAPRMTIILQPEMGWHNELDEFDLDDYDWNTMFSFHPYSPGEFTHQGIGNQPHLYNVPMPITRYVGGKKQMLADVTARVQADRSLSRAQKTAEIRRYRQILDFLWWNNGRDWENWSRLRRWVERSGINPKRIVAGEFGVVSEHNYNGTPALPDVASRAHFLRKIKNQTEANGFAGWVVHQAFGDFNLFRQKGHGWHLDTLIPELVTALFSDEPLPEGPPVVGRRR